MFDTRSGFWLMASIGILSVIATGAVIAFASDASITQNNFSAAIGFPMSVLLPVIAALAVTGEYSQRTGLTTYTLVPRRGRVVVAKLVTVVAVGIVSMFVALGVGAVGTLLGAALRGTDPVWDVSLTQFGLICLANVLGMLMGFTLGVLFRNSPAALVGYFVYAFVWPTLSGLLAGYQEWYVDVQKWLDGQFNITGLFDQTPSGQGWLQLLVATTLFLWVPLAVGLRVLHRSEVK
jgi:ABC-type transport system involved in multi-copper enzyme maturation permease subunit